MTPNPPPENKLMPDVIYANEKLIWSEFETPMDAWGGKSSRKSVPRTKYIRADLCTPTPPAQAEPTEMREKLHALGKRAHNVGQGREPDDNGTIFEKASHAISILIGDLLYMADRFNEGGRFRDTIKLGEDAISGLERATKPNEPTDAERDAGKTVDDGSS